MNLFIKHKQTHRHGKQAYGYQSENEQGRDNQEFEINRQTALYIKQITNKDLLYSKRNYTQYFVSSFPIREKNLKKNRYIDV